MPLVYLGFIFFKPRIAILVSLLQFRVAKRLLVKSRNERTRIYVTLLICNGCLNVPIIFFTFILFPTLFVIPLLVLSKYYMGLVYIGGYLISLNFFPKMIGRVILIFTMYKKIDSGALDFIKTSRYVKQQYSRDLMTDFYRIIYAMQRIENRKI